MIEGQTSRIKGVLTLWGEVDVHKRASFYLFCDSLCNYVTTKLKEAYNVTFMIRDFKDLLVN